jgi:hypothetical protein
MGFIALLIATAVAIAGSAAYFSIFGLAQIWNAAFWGVVIMATSLEIGKLVTVSYLYRYWDDTVKSLRAYMMGAILVLMLVTSGGIFGFLSSAYQKDILPLEQMHAQVVQLEEQKVEWSELKTERLERRKQIDTDIASLPNNYITGRQRLMESYGPELKQIRTDIEYYTKQLQAATTQIHELKSQVIQQEVHTGPIIFIAKAFDQTVDTAVKWMTLLIIFAFDPLAVALTIGANIAIMKRNELAEFLKETNERLRRRNCKPAAHYTVEEAIEIEKEWKEELGEKFETFLADISPENTHPETDTGPDVGCEVLAVEDLPEKDLAAIEEARVPSEFDHLNEELVSADGGKKHEWVKTFNKE